MAPRCTLHWSLCHLHHLPIRAHALKPVANSATSVPCSALSCRNAAGPTKPAGQETILNPGTNDRTQHYIVDSTVYEARSFRASFQVQDTKLVFPFMQHSNSNTTQQQQAKQATKQMKRTTPSQPHPHPPTNRGQQASRVKQ